MHYKNGREAKNGDKVFYRPAWGAPLVGILYDATAGNDSCNGRLAPCLPTDQCPDLKDCLHVDDVGERAKIEPTEQKAERMYESYCVAVGGKAFNGDPLPTWRQFRDDPTKLKQSEAWVAIAKLY